MATTSQRTMMPDGAGAGSKPDDERVAFGLHGVAHDIELRRIAWGDANRRLIVFLHEGLGSLSAWKDFPDRLCASTNCRGLVYSRAGYGGSLPRAATTAWSTRFLHDEATGRLPALLQAAGVDSAADRPWLFGHSDGASIGLLHAAAFPDRVRGCIAVAPHVFVEDVTSRSIAALNAAYGASPLQAALARHHDEPDAVFERWAGVWLDPAFAAWSIEAEIASISCPLLALQGSADEYGTLEQLRRIAAQVPHARLLELPGCGHWPQRDRTEDVIAACERMIAA